MLDLSIVLDSSGSIHADRFEIVKTMMVAVVQQLEISPDKTRVALVYYSTMATYNFNFLQYPAKQVRHYIFDVKPVL